jgi:hypothetical protein
LKSPGALASVMLPFLILLSTVQAIEGKY